MGLKCPDKFRQKEVKYFEMHFGEIWYCMYIDKLIRKKWKYLEELLFQVIK